MNKHEYNIKKQLIEDILKKASELSEAGLGNIKFTCEVKEYENLYK